MDFQELVRSHEARRGQFAQNSDVCKGGGCTCHNSQSMGSGLLSVKADVTGIVSKRQDKLVLSIIFVLFILLMLLLMLIPAPERAYTQWPPFRFRLTPSYENGRIIYGLRFSNRVDWSMTGVTIKIPLPEGTRFVEASAQPGVSVDVDGTEVTFFSYAVGRPIRDASFVVEVTDPEASVFTTHASISWQGDHAGDYLTEEVIFDISSQS